MLGLACTASPAFAALYSENFDDGAADNWVVSSGDWAVSSGTDKTYTNSTTTVGPEIAYYNGASWTTGYTYAARLHTWGTGWGNQVSLIYNYQDDDNYYEIAFGGALDGANHNVHLYECVSGTSTEVAGGNYTNPSNRLIDVEVVRAGNDTTIKVGGSTVLTRTQTALTGGGKIGVADRYAAGYINNIVVTDTEAPAVTITSPADDAVISGIVNVTSNATDNIGVAGVQYKLDGGNLDAETSSPFTLAWNTTLVPSGAHTLTAVARDTSGNLSTPSTGVDVFVGNSLPGSWTASDIGTFTPAGSTNYSDGTYIVEGGGSNIWDTSDEFQFARVSGSGDLTIVARVVTQGNSFQWAKAGIMIRESSSPTSKYVLLCVTPNGHILFEARTGSTAPDNASIQPGSVDDINLPMWLRLVRAGNTFHASYSDDGVSWVTTDLATSSIDVSMGSSVLAGLAVCSCDEDVTSTATFDGVAVHDTGDYKVLFPKLAGVNYGGKNYDDSGYQADLAKLDFVVLGFYRNWSPAPNHPSIRDAVQQIKALNPNMLVGQYTIQESIYLQTNSTDALYDVNVKLNSETGPNGIGDWWARDNQGQHTAEVSNQPETNITAFTQPDASGLRFPQWMAQRNYDVFFDWVPEFDVWFIDNVFYRPRKDADWDRNGINDSKDNGTVRTYYRQGNVDYVTTINQVDPGVLIMGNVDGRSDFDEGFLRESQYQGLFAGALQEHAIGQSNSEETYSGWSNMMESYRSLMAHTIAPHLVIFSADGSDTDYATFRYAFASALLDDGYFAYNELNSSGRVTYSDVDWFDEYDLAGTSTTSWLGAAIDPPPTSAIADGVYVRRFEHGMAIVNPKGNGTGSINLSTLFPGETYKRISGTQDSTTNNGTTVTSLSLPDRSGLILVKAE